MQNSYSLKLWKFQFKTGYDEGISRTDFKAGRHENHVLWSQRDSIYAGFIISMMMIWQQEIESGSQEEDGKGDTGESFKH